MLNYFNKRINRDDSGKTYTLVDVVCPECNKKFSVRFGNLKNGQRSCGCLKGNRSHGMTKTRPYVIWQNMRKRCEKEYSLDWDRYGGRGIYVCEEWKNFSSFWRDMKDGYDSKLTLGRIDNNLGYCRDNCRWESNLEQSRNKGNSIVYKNETARQAGIRINGNPSLVYQRLNAGWSKEDAFTKKSKRHKEKPA